MTSLVKTVEMRVLADAGDAQAKLDDLDAKAKDLDGNAIKMRFRLDDGDGKAQLDELQAKADKLGYKDVSIKVRVDGAGRAIAELDAVKHEADEASSGGGLLGKLFGGGPPLSGAESAGGGIPILGSLFGPAGLAIVPAIGAALVEVTGLVSGLAAAGAGAGAFAALALPAVKSVEGAYTSLNAAQQKYNQAKATYDLVPNKSNATSLVTAAEQLVIAQRAIKKLPESEQQAISGIQKLTAEYSKMSKAFQPQAFKIFADGLSIVGHLLPTLTPFANTFATSLDGLLKQADKFTQSKGFAAFLKQFQGIEGPAIGAIGDGIGKVTGAIGKLLTTMSGKDVARTIGIAFNAVAASISIVSGIVHRLMTNWDQASSDAKIFGHAVAAAWDSIVGSAKAAYEGVMGAWSAMLRFLAGIPGKVKGYFADAGHWLIAAGRAVLEGFLSGIKAGWDDVAGFVGSIAGKIADLKGPLPKDLQLLVPHGAAIMSGLIAGMNSKMDELKKTAKKAAKTVTVTIAASILTDLQGGQSAINTALTAVGNVVAGPDSTISGAIAKLKADVKGKTGLTKWLTSENTRLQGLAAERAKLEAEIADSQQAAQAEISNASVMNAAGAIPSDTSTAAPPLTSTQLIAGMQYQRDQLRQFAAAVAQLQKMGLNATSLSQITGAGTAAGLPVAQALTAGGKSAIAQMNQLQGQIKGAADKLGDAAAPSMYQAGVEAAQGLASGLKSQLKALDKVMGDLATSIVAAIRKALKSHSPSLVMAEVGLSIPQGLALGIEQGAAVAVSASTRLAARTVAPWAGAGHGGGGGDMHFNINGVVTDPQGVARQVVQVLKEYKRNGGGTQLGIA